MQIICLKGISIAFLGYLSLVTLRAQTIEKKWPCSIEFVKEISNPMVDSIFNGMLKIEMDQECGTTIYELIRDERPTDAIESDFVFHLTKYCLFFNHCKKTIHGINTGTNLSSVTSNKRRIKYGDLANAIDSLKLYGPLAILKECRIPPNSFADSHTLLVVHDGSPILIIHQNGLFGISGQEIDDLRIRAFLRSYLKFGKKMK